MRKLIVALSTAVLAGSVGLLTMGGLSGTEDASSAPSGAASATPSSGERPSGTTPERKVAFEQRYKLTYEHQIQFGDDLADPTTLSGVWTTVSLGDDRVEARLSDVVLSGDPSLPKATEIKEPFQMGLKDGKLSLLGFPGGTADAARELESTLASVLEYTPGEGSSWTAFEEDRIGKYRAEYKRTGDEVVRTRARYIASRSADGRLSENDVERLSAAGAARFEVDSEGRVVSAAINEGFKMMISEDLPAVVVTVNATLTRLDAREVPPPERKLLALAPIPGFKADANHEHNQDAKLLGDADAETLLKEARALAGLPKGDKAAAEQKIRAYKRLRAFLRLHPEETEKLEDAYLEQVKAGEQIPQVLTSALAQAGTPEGSEALARLLGEEIPPDAKKDVAMSAALVDEPTEETTEALLSTLDDNDAGGYAALALGVQANKLAETDPEAAEAIVDELVKRYKSATTDGAKLTYLDALGNSGHPKAYPFLEEATRSSNPRYEKIGTYGMRFLPGADADNVLELQLASSTKSTQLAAVHAIGFRSADTWRSVLEAARSNAPGEVQGAIDRVLRMWS